MSNSNTEVDPKSEMDSTENSVDSSNQESHTCLCKLIFEFPEKFMRRMFRAITISICKHPIVYLLGYLALLCVIIVTSFTLARPTSVPVYDAYQPELYRQRADLSQKIDRDWNQFLNKSSDKIIIDTFRVLFYDIQLKSTTDKMDLFKGVNDICQLIQGFSIILADNLTLSLQTIQQKLSKRSKEVPKLCQLVEKVKPYLPLAEQAGFLESLTNLLSPEVLKKHLGEELGDVGSAAYVSALPPITFTVERSSRSLEWQLQVLEAALKFRKVLEEHADFKITFSTSAYMRSEEMMVLKSEVPKLIISITILVVTTLAVSINFCSWIHSKALMAIAAVIMSVLAVLTGLAVGNICGFKWLSLLAFVPFLIVGIGLDSAFLLVHQWLLSIRSGRHKNYTTLMVETVDGCFLSVTLSDFTAIGAFGVGAITPFQAVNLCCAYLALCVVFLWITELFFFLPCLTIKSIRVLKMQSCTWKTIENESNVESSKCQKETIDNGKVVDATYCPELPEETAYLPKEKPKAFPGNVFSKNTKSINRKQCNIFGTRSIFNTYENLVMKFLVFIISKEVFRIIWAVIFVCVSISAVYNTKVMKPYEANDKYYDDNSVTREYYVALRDYALWKSVWSRIILPQPNIFDPSWNTRLTELQIKLKTSEIYSDFEWLNCYFNFTQKVSGFDEDIPRFYSAMRNAQQRQRKETVCADLNQHSLLQTEEYKRKVDMLLRTCNVSVAYSIQRVEADCKNQVFEFEDDNEIYSRDHTNSTVFKMLFVDHISMESSRKMVQMGDTNKECEVLDTILDIEKTFSDINIGFYDWSIPLMWRNCLMVESLWRSVGIAGLCCLVMVTVFIPHVLLIVTILLMTCFTFLHILGTMSLIGLTYCTQTYVVSLIAMGMCIDYVAHSGRCFFNAHRDINSDLPAVLAKTMTEISVPLTNSALTTIAGISLLMFANSAMFREIGYAVVAIFAHSYLNGCFILPVLLFYLCKLNQLLFKPPAINSSNLNSSQRITTVQHLHKEVVASNATDVLEVLESNEHSGNAIC